MTYPIDTSGKKMDDNDDNECKLKKDLRRKLGSCIHETILNSTMHGKYSLQSNYF
jgi:hypothetical protein